MPKYHSYYFEQEVVINEKSMLYYSCATGKKGIIIYLCETTWDYEVMTEDGEIYKVKEDMIDPIRDKKRVFLLMGESGSGKTSITKELQNRGFNILQSYTTRQPREENEFGHLFCSIEEYEKFKQEDQIVAYSYFNNHHYFSTKEQMYNCDVYVVDPDGIKDLKSKVKDIEFVTIYLKVNWLTRAERMFNRGDDHDKVEDRLQYDFKKFKDKEYEYAVINDDFNKTVDIIEYIIRKNK